MKLLYYHDFSNQGPVQIREMAFDRWGAVQIVLELERMGFKALFLLDRVIRNCRRLQKN